MRVAYNASDDRAGLRGCVQFNKYTYIHIQCEWHRMTDRMTGPDCAVMCNLINIHVVVVVVVVSHIQRIGCQPEKLL